MSVQWNVNFFYLLSIFPTHRSELTKICIRNLFLTHTSAGWVFIVIVEQKTSISFSSLKTYMIISAILILSSSAPTYQRKRAEGTLKVVASFGDRYEAPVNDHYRLHFLLFDHTRKIGISCIECSSCGLLHMVSEVRYLKFSTSRKFQSMVRNSAQCSDTKGGSY